MAVALQSSSRAADRVQIGLLRRASTAERAARALSLSATVIALSRRAIRQRHPDWSEREVLLEWMRVHYGRELAERVREDLDRRGP